MTPLQQRRQNQYRQILENIANAVIAVDQSGIVVFFNATAQNYMGISEKQILGCNLFSCFKSQTTLCHLAKVALAEGRSISSHETVTLKTVTSQQRQVTITASPIFPLEEPQQGAVIVLHDLTRVRSLEGAERHADQLAMIETMAAGLAHEIKNPLGGIKGSAQLLQMELAGNDELQEYTRLIVREAERVNRIIEELLNLSRPRRSQHEKINIGQILDEIVKLQKNSAAERGIRFRWQLDPSIPDIRGDRDLLTSLFLNLIKNGCEATPDSSEILVQTGIDTEYHLSLPGSRPTPMVEISISDQGPGIPESDREKIFTPFYTTKTGGNGLGLPICQKIVTDHGGQLQLIDRPEGGTRVKVSLPLYNYDHEQSQNKGK